MQTYDVTCLSCDGQRRIRITKSAMGNVIDWLERDAPNPPTIISGRERLDGEWGWQCACGNNSLLTQQEAKSFSDPRAPKPEEIADIVANLQVEMNPFKLQAV